MDDETSPQVSEQLQQLGSMNFDLPATVGGSPARVTMNSSHAFVVVDGPVVRVVSAPFAEVTSGGAGRGRTVTVAGEAVPVEFGSDADAERFDRVLDVRQTAAAVASGAVPPPTYNTRVPRPTSAQSYVEWSGWAMAASTALLVIAFIDLVVGVILAVVVLADGSALLALITLFGTAAGCALPACLAALTRSVIFRHRMQDEAAR